MSTHHFLFTNFLFPVSDLTSDIVDDTLMFDEDEGPSISKPFKNKTFLHFFR